MDLDGLRTPILDKNSDLDIFLRRACSIIYAA